MKFSRGFVCMLIGFAMTLFAWFGPWEWPAAAAYFVLNQFFGGDYSGFPTVQRALVLLLLIVVNVASWALVSYVVITAIRAVTGKREEVVETPETLE
jgi:hypothetical protein